MRTCLMIFVVFFMSCRDTASKLPVLSYRIDPSGNRAEYVISFDKFKDQNGSRFDTEKVKGKVYVANFFFTRCPSICPPMRLSLIDLANEVPDPEFVLVSHTIDPEYDKVNILKRYSEETGIADDKWFFIRSDLTSTREHAATFMTNFSPNEEGTDFYHSSYLALVDRSGYIRGFYNSLVEEECDRLKKDIRVLLEDD